MFESNYNLRPSDLHDVMALSSGDSIFASSALLKDPADTTFAHGHITRVRGNIGRPGMAFLVPPRDPLIQDIPITEWSQFVKQEEYDGHSKDSFETTSLHLSFTGAHTPLNIGFSGAQDDNLYLLETLISVHENGKWIADLDPLRGFGDPYYGPRFTIVPPCSDKSNHDPKGPNKPSSSLLCIDNWVGLITTPKENSSIVRAKGNWEARLAAASISLSRNNHTIILPEDVCWHCVSQTCFDRFLYLDETHDIIYISWSLATRSNTDETSESLKLENFALLGEPQPHDIHLGVRIAWLAWSQ